MTQIVRHSIDGQVAYGILVGQSVYELIGDLYDEFERGSYVAEAMELSLLAPCEPKKIVGVGLNYRAHIEELGFHLPDEPVLFSKPPSAVVGPGGEIRYPAISNEVGFGAELAVVMKRRTKAISPSEAPDHILGYTCANDVTARDLARTDSAIARAKGLDTFCPLGPSLATVLDESDLIIRSRLNGELRQESSTVDMLFQVSELVSFISEGMTLEPGDVILTGTPAGAGLLVPGDVVEVEIEGIGTLVNHVVLEQLSHD